MKHYFAYGTLLDIEAMQSLTPSATPEGLMKLHGYRMGFAKCHDGVSGGCTLEPEAGAALYGMLYSMSDEDLAALHKAAGVEQDLWRPIDIDVVADDGQVVPTITYIIPNSLGEERPSAEYVRPILQGLAALPFPPEYVDKMKRIIAQAQAISLKKPPPEAA